MDVDVVADEEVGLFKPMAFEKDERNLGTWFVAVGHRITSAACVRRAADSKKPAAFARGVMREATVMLCAILAGCTSTPPKAPITAAQMCVLDRAEPWIHIPNAPDSAEQLVALADDNPVFPNSSMRLPTASWFRLDDGALLLCRHDNSTCVGEWWVFRFVSGHWKVEQSDGWVCVT